MRPKATPLEPHQLATQRLKQDSGEEFWFDLKKFELVSKVLKTFGGSSDLEKDKAAEVDRCDALLVLWKLVKKFKRVPEALFSQLLNIREGSRKKIRKKFSDLLNWEGGLEGK